MSSNRLNTELTTKVFLSTIYVSKNSLETTESNGIILYIKKTVLYIYGTFLLLPNYCKSYT